MGGPQGQSYKNTCQKQRVAASVGTRGTVFLDSSMNIAWICLDMFNIYIYMLYYVIMLTYLKMYFDMDM